MSETTPPPLPPEGGSGAPPPVPPPVPTTPPPAPTAPAAPSPLSATCPSCGAQTAYTPGSTTLTCGSCGAVRDIEASTTAIREHSFDEWFARSGQTTVASLAGTTMRCQNCGATTETTDLATTCQFCAGALVAVENPPGLVQPEAVVPFKHDRSAAETSFGEWIGGRFWAPNKIKTVRGFDGLKGTYVPHWTFDAQTETDYEGKRGEYYYVSVSYTDSEGKQRTRQERRTRWYDHDGHVSRDFDDLVVIGSTTVDRAMLEKMGPWELGDAVPYQQDYLTGYAALRYDVDPVAGAEDARGKMRARIEQDCEADIGGDEQRVERMDVTYAAVTFKLLLMPLWIATYLYGGTTYQVLVNANTGEVNGTYPLSKVKIAIAVLLGLVVAAGAIYLYASSR